MKQFLFSFIFHSFQLKLRKEKKLTKGVRDQHQFVATPFEIMQNELNLEAVSLVKSIVKSRLICTFTFIGDRTEVFLQSKNIFF